MSVTPSSKLNRLLFCASMTVALVIALSRSLSACDGIDDVMYQEPAFEELTTVIKIDENLIPLWIEALNQPDSELQLLAADSIALAHLKGTPGLLKTADRLIELVADENTNDTVRHAAGRALVVLDAQSAADAFRQVMQTSSLELASITEPALAKWNDKAASESWRSRLNDASTEPARRLLAINCLGTVKDAEAAPALLTVVADTRLRMAIRLAAARAVQQINTGDILTVAKSLAATEQADQQSDCLLAATLLGSQTTPEATSLLKKLASNTSPIVAGTALRALFEIDPSHVASFAESQQSNRDVKVRRVVAEAMAIQADAKAVSFIGKTLNDINPTLRQFAAATLIRFAKDKGLQDEVIPVALATISGDGGSKSNWRAIEQAIVVLGSLDHEPAAGEFLELLNHRRPEVAIAAAWGLRKLAIADTLPKLLEYAEEGTQKYFDANEEWRIEFYSRQLSQLFQAFGTMKFSDAEPLLKEFIPKNTTDPVAIRAAAIWAIGKIREGDLDEGLAAQLAGRANDTGSAMEEAELVPVRRMSAIALGRMKADSHVRTLRRVVANQGSTPGQASAWAIERINGEVLKVPTERIVNAKTWFLVPN